MSKFSNYLKDEMGQFGWVVLPSTNSSSLNTSLTNIIWYKDPRVKEEEKKELSIEELFNNVKKELKEVSVKLN